MLSNQRQSVVNPRPRVDLDGSELDNELADAFGGTPINFAEAESDLPKAKRVRRAVTEIDVLTRTIKQLSNLAPTEADWVVNALNRKFGSQAAV